MEDHFDKLLYLVVGVIYFYLHKAAKNRNAEKQTIPDTPSERPSAPTTSTDWENTWGNDAQNAPVKKPLRQTAMAAKRPLLPEHNTATYPAAQQLHGKKIDSVLRRYGGWKKAMIMHELIQPYS